jgi:hypothetical protein
VWFCCFRLRGQRRCDLLRGHSGVRRPSSPTGGQGSGLRPFECAVGATRRFVLVDRLLCVRHGGTWGELPAADLAARRLQRTRCVGGASACWGRLARSQRRPEGAQRQAEVFSAVLAPRLCVRCAAVVRGAELLCLFAFPVLCSALLCCSRCHRQTEPTGTPQLTTERTNSTGKRRLGKRNNRLSDSSLELR